MTRLALIGLAARAADRKLSGPEVFLWSALLLAALLAGCEQARRPSVASAAAGVADLRTLPFVSEALRLEDGWVARPDDGRPTPDVFGMNDDPSWRPVKLGQAFAQQGLPAEGAAWYRLRVRLPEQGASLHGLIQEGGVAHRLYLSRPGGEVRLLAEAGKPDVQRASTYPSARRVTFTLPAQGGEAVLVWHVAHYGTPATPVRAPLVGSDAAVRHVLVREDAVLFGTAGVCLGLLLCFAFVWLRQRYNLRVLAFMLVVSVLMVRVLATGGVLGDLLGGLRVDGRVTIEMLSQYLLLGGSGLLVWTLFPLEFAALRVGPLRIDAPPASPSDELTLPGLASRRLRTMHTASVLAALVLSSLFCGLTLVLPDAALRAVAFAAWISTALLTPMLLSVAVAAWRHRRPGAGLFLLTAIPLVLASTTNIVLGLRGMPIYPGLVTYSYLGLLGAVGVALTRRLAQSAEESAAANRLLADRVAQRSRELQVASVAAQAAGLAKTQFLTAVSHEIRTPLAAMLGFTQVLREELDPRLEAHHGEFFDSIQRSGDRLMRLVNDLIDLSRAEAGGLDVHADAVALRGPLEDVMDRLAPIAHGKGLALSLELPETAVPRVRGDETRLKQVFYHLVSNAVKFTDDGSVRVAVAPAEIDGLPAWRIEVRDTGVGISATFRPFVFDRFSQEERAYAQAGTGLGLALVRELVGRMHGEVGVESTEGEGSTFAVVLPALADDVPERLVGYAA